MSDVSKFNVDGTVVDVKDPSARTPTFTQASTRANIVSGESQGTLFGKISKWFADLKTVAFTGSYNDLSDKPTIPSVVTVDSALSTTSTNPVQNKIITSALNGKANSSSLATVATSGSYNDLSNKPTIPTAVKSISRTGTTDANGLLSIPGTGISDMNSIIGVTNDKNSAHYILGYYIGKRIKKII